jgi:hypothetical protein
MTISFTAKFAAFMLNGMKANVKCGPELGFERFNQTEVLGLLPFLHLNLNEKEYKELMLSTKDNMTNVLLKICNDRNLDSNLSTVGFKCSVHGAMGTEALIDRMIDTIKTGYEARINGKKKASQVAAFMRMQNKNNKNIPDNSIKWCKGIPIDSSITKFTYVKN